MKIPDWVPDTVVSDNIPPLVTNTRPLAIRRFSDDSLAVIISITCSLAVI